MASGRPVLSTPLIQTPDDDDPVDSPLEHDQQRQQGYYDSPTPGDADGFFLDPSPRAAPSSAYLSPDSSRGARRPNSRPMASEDAADAEGAPAASPAPGPFNFETQVMSNTPVKSVRCVSSLARASLPQPQDQERAC